jgi:hypothetical protein
MSGGVVYWYDLMTLKRKGGEHEHDHDQRDVVVRMPQQAWRVPHKQHCARSRRRPPHRRQEHLSPRRHHCIGVERRWLDSSRHGSL